MAQEVSEGRTHLGAEQDGHDGQGETNHVEGPRNNQVGHVPKLRQTIGLVIDDLHE